MQTRRQSLNRTFMELKYGDYFAEVNEYHCVLIEPLWN